MIKQYKTDAAIELSGLRGKEPMSWHANLTKKPDPPNELPKHEEETFEFTLRDLSFADRVNRRLDLNSIGIDGGKCGTSRMGSPCWPSPG